MIRATAPLLPDYFKLHAKWRADKPALICGDKTYSWAEFVKTLNQISNGLSQDGLQKGDRVIVVMDNSAAMAEVLFGIMIGGYVSAPLNTSVSSNAIRNMIVDSGAKAIFASGTHLEKLNHILKEMGEQAPEILISAEGYNRGWMPYEKWVSRASMVEPSVQIGPNDYLNIIYSSGTTGQPKGIAHTHQGRLNWAYDLANALRYNSSARFMATIGLYSNITWVGMLCTLVSGGTLIVKRKFDPFEAWEDIQSLGVTHLSMVPILFERLIDCPDNAQFDGRSMQGMMSAGSPLRADIRERLFERFSCGITELYGLTEGVITTLDPEEASGRMSSVGKPILGSDLMILDDCDKPCPPKESGEIVMSTRFVMPGYLNRDDATNDSLFIDQTGQHWLRTGDIGYLDEERYLYIVDRKKDMIISGGQNIYPQDIEAVIIAHKNVADVAVIGVKSKKWGETPLAIVCSKNGKIDPLQLKNWTNSQVGKQQRIAGVKVFETIPRNPNGKILKRQLREQFKDIQYE